jgi:hypothetical protein
MADGIIKDSLGRELRIASEAINDLLSGLNEATANPVNIPHEAETKSNDQVVKKLDEIVKRLEKFIGNKDLHSEIDRVTKGMKEASKLYEKMQEKKGKETGTEQTSQKIESFSERAGKALMIASGSFAKATAQAGVLLVAESRHLLVGMVKSLTNAVLGLAKASWYMFGEHAKMYWTDFVVTPARAAWWVIKKIGVGMWKTLEVAGRAAMFTVKEFVKILWDDAVGFWKEIAPVAKYAWNQASRFAKWSWDGLSSYAIKKWDEIKVAAGIMWGDIKNLAHGVWNFLRIAGDKAMFGLRVAWIAGSQILWNTVGKYFMAAWNGIWPYIAEVGKKTFGAIATAASYAWDNVIGPKSPLGQGIKKMVTGIASGFPPIFSGLRKGLSRAFEAYKGKPPVGGPPVPPAAAAPEPPPPPEEKGGPASWQDCVCSIYDLLVSHFRNSSNMAQRRAAQDVGLSRQQGKMDAKDIGKSVGQEEKKGWFSKAKDIAKVAIMARFGGAGAAGAAGAASGKAAQEETAKGLFAGLMRRGGGKGAGKGGGGTEFRDYVRIDRLSRIGQALTSAEGKPTQNLIRATNVGNIAATLPRMLPNFLGGGMLGDITETAVNLLKEPLLKQVEYYQDIRDTAFAVTAQSMQGLAVQDKVNDAVKQWEVGVDAVRATGQSLTIIQQAQLKGLRRGIQDVGKLNKLTTTSLNLAKFLGSSAEGTTEFFADMHQHMRLDNIQLGTFAIGMREIARQTGLTGDNLLKVAQNSEQFMKAMRNAGTLTADAARNVTRLMAEGQRTGTSDQMQKILKSMTSTTELMMGGDRQIQGLLFSATRGNERLRRELIAGTITDNQEGMRELTDGMEDLFKQFTGVALQDLDKLSPEAKARANLALKAAFGMETGEFKLIIENFRRASMSFTQQLNEISGARGLTQQAKDEQRRSAMFGKSIEYLNKFDEALKATGGDYEAAMARFTERAGADLQENLRALNVQGGNAPMELLQRAAEDVQKRLSSFNLDKKYEGDIRELANLMTQAQTTADPRQRGEAMQGALDRMIALDQIANEHARAMNNPVSNIDKNVAVIEAKVQEIAQHLISTGGAVIDTFIGKLEGSKWFQMLTEGDVGGAWEALKEELSNLPHIIANEWADEFEKLLPESFRPTFRSLMTILAGVAEFISKAVVPAIEWFVVNVLPKITEGIIWLIDAFNGLDDETKKVIGWIVGAVGLLWALGLLGPAMTIVGTAITTLAGLLTGGGGMAAALGGAAIPLVALTAAVYAFGRAAAKAEIEGFKEMDRQREGTLQQGEAQAQATETEQNRLQIRNLSEDQLLGQIRQFDSEIGNLTHTLNEATRSLTSTGTTIQTVAKTFFAGDYADEMANEAQRVANDVSRRQAQLRRQREVLMHELIRRQTEDRLPEEVVGITMRHQQERERREGLQSAQWNRFRTALGTRNQAINDMGYLKGRKEELINLGLPREEVEAILDRHTHWSGDDPYEAVTDLNRLFRERFTQGDFEAGNASNRQMMETSRNIGASYDTARAAKRRQMLLTLSPGIEQRHMGRLEEMIDRYLTVQASATRDLGFGDIRSAGAFQAPVEHRDRARWDAWQRDMTNLQTQFRELTGQTVDLNAVNRELTRENERQFMLQRQIREKNQEIVAAGQRMNERGAANQLGGYMQGGNFFNQTFARYMQAELGLRDMSQTAFQQAIQSDPAKALAAIRHYLSEMKDLKAEDREYISGFANRIDADINMVSRNRAAIEGLQRQVAMTPEEARTSNLQNLMAAPRLAARPEAGAFYRAMQEQQMGGRIDLTNERAMQDFSDALGRTIGPITRQQIETLIPDANAPQRVILTSTTAAARRQTYLTERRALMDAYNKTTTIGEAGEVLQRLATLENAYRIAEGRPITAPGAPGAPGAPAGPTPIQALQAQMAGYRQRAVSPTRTGEDVTGFNALRNMGGTRGARIQSIGTGLAENAWQQDAVLQMIDQQTSVAEKFRLWTQVYSGIQASIDPSKMSATEYRASLNQLALMEQYVSRLQLTPVQTDVLAGLRRESGTMDRSLPTIQLPPDQVQSIAGPLRSLDQNATQRRSLYTHDVSLEEQLIPSLDEIYACLDTGSIPTALGTIITGLDKLTTEVGAEIVRNLGIIAEQTQVMVNTVPPNRRDVEEEINRRRNEDHALPQTVTSPELTQISDSEQEQVKILGELKDIMEAIKTLLTPQPRLGESRSRRIGPGQDVFDDRQDPPTLNPQWYFGKFNQGTAVQLSNQGIFGNS